MARAVGVSVENNFIRGLVTEATGLNFPENACTETYDCIFDEKGVASRRLGFDFEASHTTETVNRTSGVVSYFTWDSVALDGDVSFFVLQVGSTLYFYKIGLSTTISLSLHATTVDLTDFSPAGAPNPATNECQFSSGNGLLFVTHTNLETFYVSYDATLDDFDTEEITIQIRDFEGLATTQAVDLRPTSTLAGLTDIQEYNLRNQGWATANLTAWDTANTTMPSDADVPWYFKDADDDFDFTSATIDSFTIGNSPAPKGKFILDFYFQDRDAASGMSGIADVTTEYVRASTSGFFAGRLFLSGVNYEGHGSKIFFTQIIDEPAQYSKFYQRNDPTSEFLFDLLPNDGGVIVIPEAGTITKLIPLGTNLIVFATQGIWAISGSEGLGFTANDYSINKLSGVPAPFPSNFVIVEGFPLWWNTDGIYTIARGQAEVDSPQVSSLSDDTIRAFFQQIPSECIQFARGVYNTRTRIVQWLFRSEASETLSQRYEYDRVLNLNVKSGALYPWTVSESDVTINGAFIIEGFSGSLEAANVVDNTTDNVVDNTTDQVIAFVAETRQIDQKIVYIMSYQDGATYELTFGYAEDDTYTDFTTYEGTGIDYTSYFVTGYKVHGEAIRKFQSNYIETMTNPPYPNAFTIQGRWDYANDSSTGRWSSSQSVLLDGAPYLSRSVRRKVRGHGKALQLMYSSVSGQPMYISGWSIFETANQSP